MTSIEIQNLKCGGCANTVTKAVQSIEGISEISVDVETSKISFNAINTEVIQDVKVKLSKLGYPEINTTNTTLHKVKSYVSCATGKMTTES